MQIKLKIHALLRPNNKIDFLRSLNSTANILDVGCGNNSPYLTKKILPQCHYVGLDISDHNQTSINKSDIYVVTTPENFNQEIFKFEEEFDAVVSAHNLEHCNNREETLLAMMRSLKIGGKLYLSFPSPESLEMPSRKGTLNYLDDSTHIGYPPDYYDILEKLTKNNFQIIFSKKNYRPKIMGLIGRILEPLSIIKNKVMIGTWEYHGFESITIAKKTSNK